MTGTRYTTEEKMGILREADLTGKEPDSICQKYGISRASFYKWKRHFRPADSWEARWLKEMKQRNHELQQILTDLLMKNWWVQIAHEKELPTNQTNRSNGCEK